MGEQVWPEFRLGDVCDKIGSGATPRGGESIYCDNGIVLIRSQNVYNGAFNPDGLAHIRDKDAAALDNVTLRSEDILLNITGDSVARCCQVPAGMLPGRVNQHVAIIRPRRSELDARFLLYYLVSPAMQEFMLSIASAGATRNALTKAMISDFRVPCPSLGEQRAIGELLGALDDKIELNRRMNRTLEETASALFRSWFIDFDPVVSKAAGREPFSMDAPTASLFPSSFDGSKLGPVPHGWRVQRLAEVCTTQYGYTASASPHGVGPQFLRITDINKLPWIEWRDVPRCAIDGADIDRYRLHRGDLVVSRMADPGKVGIVEADVDAVFASYLVRLSVPSASAYRVFYFLRSAEYLDYAEGAQVGTVQQSMNAKIITGCDLVVPPSIVDDAFDRRVRPLRELVTATVAESATLAAVRDTLLPKLFSGEIRLRDAEREVEDAVA